MITEERAREILDPYLTHGPHTFDHIKRVYNLAIHIAGQEKADIEVVRTASLFHDIARAKEQVGEVEDHASPGLRLPERFWSKKGLSRNLSTGFAIASKCIAIGLERPRKLWKPRFCRTQTG